MSSIKTNIEFPRGDDPIKQGQRLAQDLSSNFKAIDKLINGNIPGTSISLSSIFSYIQPVGSIIHSMLTEAQFQSETGANWILADGRDVTGSSYSTITGIATCPDLRGVTLRGKNNGSSRNPDGDVALGTYQADELYSHTHTQNAHSHLYIASTIGGGFGAAGVAGTAPYNGTTTDNTTATNQNFGGNETRMKNVTVNIFIRIN